MLENQNKLPSLPIPELDNLNKLLNWIKPIVDNEEFKKTKDALNEFLIPNNDGEKLQKKLIEISNESSSSNWLEPFWDNKYLAYRGQLVSNMNYYAILENEKLKANSSLPSLSARLVYELLSVYKKISDKNFEPELIKGNPQCMDQYNNIFKAVRLPLLKKDKYKAYEYSKNHHIVVFYNNNIFKLETSDLDGNIISVESIASKIKKITDANIQDRGIDIGALTTAKRDDAAKLYNDIEMDAINKKSLEIINTAVFVLCIDPEAKSLQDFQKMMLLSKGKNRYFDKSCQLIISEDLEIGFNNEHTGADATPWFNVINRVYNKALNECSEKIELADTSMPEELKWNLSDEIKSKLKHQLNKHQKFAENIHVENLIFNDFGKKMIKNLKMSPDAYFHIALQVAQYKTFGELKSTYESVSMRHFKKGRTECSRGVNENVLEFAKNVLSNECSKNRLKELLINAQKSHVNRIKECQIGLGVERHLFALYKVYEKYGEELGIYNIPKLYNTKGYKLLTNDFISASGLSDEGVSLFGFGPVVADGYGIGYIINEKVIKVTLSTETKNKEIGALLLNNLKDSFFQIKDILIS